MNTDTDGETFKAARLHARLIGIRREDAAALLGVHRTTITRWEESRAPRAAWLALRACGGGELGALCQSFDGFYLTGAGIVTPAGETIRAGELEHFRWVMRLLERRGQKGAVLPFQRPGASHMPPGLGVLPEPGG